MKSAFPIITPKIQEEYEQRQKSNEYIPIICGYHGRACRQMQKEANTMICTSCSLQKYANEKERKSHKRISIDKRNSKREGLSLPYCIFPVNASSAMLWSL